MKTEFLKTYNKSSLGNLSLSTTSLFKTKKASISCETTSSEDSQNAHSLEEIVTTSSSVDKKKDEDSGISVGQFFGAKRLKKIFPILDWLPRYSVSKLIADVIAGISVGLTVLPQGLALASVAGLPPQYGLYSGFVGCFLYILFGGTKCVTIGPTAMMAIMTLSYAGGKPPQYSVLLCFLTGVVTMLMGIFKLGFIVNFMSLPVISGFTSAAALTICSTQIKFFFGLDFQGQGFLNVIIKVFQNLGNIKLYDTIVSAISITTLYTLMKLKTICRPITKNRPMLGQFVWFLSAARSAIVIVAFTVIFAVINKDPADVQIVGDLVSGIPPFKVPEFSFIGNNTLTGEQNVTYSIGSIMQESFSALVVIPLLALIELYSAANACSGTDKVDASQELISVGLSNLLGSFFSSMPISGAFARIILNHESGVQTPMGGLVTGLLVVVALQFLTPYFYFIPKSALGCVISMAVIFSVDFSILLKMWRSKKLDIIPWLLTFTVSLFGGLQYGILIGFVISTIYIMFYAARPSYHIKKGSTSSGTSFILVELDRSLIFPSKDKNRDIIMKAGSEWGKDFHPVVVDFHHVHFIDFSTAKGLKDLLQNYKMKNQLLLFYRMKPSIISVIKGAMMDSDLSITACSDETDLEQVLDEMFQ